MSCYFFLCTFCSGLSKFTESYMRFHSTLLHPFALLECPFPRPLLRLPSQLPDASEERPGLSIASLGNIWFARSRNSKLNWFKQRRDLIGSHNWEIQVEARLDPLIQRNHPRPSFYLSFFSVTFYPAAVVSLGINAPPFLLALLEKGRSSFPGAQSTHYWHLIFSDWIRCYLWTNYFGPNAELCHQFNLTWAKPGGRE